MRMYLQPLQDLTLEDRVARTQYRFLLSGPDNEQLGMWSQRLLERLREQPALSDVASDWQDQGLQAYVKIDRDAASRLGVSVAAVDNALYNAFGQRLERPWRPDPQPLCAGPQYQRLQRGLRRGCCGGACDTNHLHAKQPIQGGAGGRSFAPHGP